MNATYPILQVNPDRTFDMYSSEIKILRGLEDWEDQSEGIWLIDSEGYFLDGIVSIVLQKVDLRRTTIRFDKEFVHEQFLEMKRYWEKNRR